MTFTLEALAARYGDALLLHYGDPPNTQLIIIDGGPPRVYKPFLGPRLEALKQSRSPREPLRIRMMMVSHLDEDHIAGLLELTGALVRLKKDKKELPYQIATLWHNRFDDILGNVSESDKLFGDAAQAVKTVATDGQVPEEFRRLMKPHSALVLASVNQGRKLRDNARALNILNNEGFTGLVGAPPAGQKVVDMAQGLRFTVLGPHEEEVAALQVEWDKTVKSIQQKEAKEALAEAAAFVDKSVFNLSSIVVLASFGDKSMLLTGDARGDAVMKGLETAGLKEPGKSFHVDLLKLPHHGSNRNVAPEFFEQVTADHYVVSSNGEKFNNPDIDTLQWLSDARGETGYKLYLTYPEAEFDAAFDRPGFDKLLAADRKKGREYEVIFRQQGALSVHADLGQPLPD